MGTAVTATAGVKEIFAKQQKTFAAIIPKHLDPERVIRLAFLLCAKNEDLRKAADENPGSLIDAICQALSLGLEPGTAMQEAHLLTFKVKGKLTVQMVPGYQGLAKLARNSGQISNVWARVVYQCDRFEMEEGDTPHLRHWPKLDATDAEVTDDKIVGAYAVALFKDGARTFKWVPLREIVKRREVSKGAYYTDQQGKRKPSLSSPWWAWFPEQCMKTAIRIISKELPKSTELATAIELDNRVETGEATTLTELDTEDTINREVQQKTAEKTAEIKRQLKGGPAIVVDNDVDEAQALREALKGASVEELTVQLTDARKKGDDKLAETLELELDARRQ